MSILAYQQEVLIAWITDVFGRCDRWWILLHGGVKNPGRR